MKPGREHRLHIFTDRAGATLSVGKIQADWLVINDHAELERYENTGPQTGIMYYRLLHHLTVWEANELVLAERELQECDFCPEHATWRLHTRSPVDLPPLPNTPGGPIDRPLFACDTCAPMIEANAKEQLLERLLSTRIEQAIALGGRAASGLVMTPRRQTEAVLGPPMRTFIAEVFAKRKGRPERLEDPE